MNISSVERFFPLQDIPSVLRLFKFQLEECSEPDLTLLSIVVGSIENLLTSSKSSINDTDGDLFGNVKLPLIEYKVVQALHTKFCSAIKGYVDLSIYGDTKYASRDLIKRVSDVIWNSLTRSYYKDRAHLQSLYSYLTGNKLDCFGVALAVVAACQVLGFADVHLALSEDHTWIIFGKNSETAEVTWHGKGNDDKRGQDISAGIASQCWLYLNGYPVICDRKMEVAALVSSINPSLNMNNDSVEVSLMQQELLWLLYDKGYLSRYPMAIGNLGDLEEINPTAGRPLCSTLFQEAILASRMYYNNMHVYPYTYQGGYFYRHNMYKEAFESWANASDVLKQYNYTRDDEEIYKEVIEIANELIPHIMRVVSSGHDAHSILKDAECFAYLLRFYDGICQWEEGSQTPVLHIGWAKPLVNTISKFDAEVRGKVVILEQDFIDNSDENFNISIKENLITSGKTKKDKTSASLSDVHNSFNNNNNTNNSSNNNNSNSNNNSNNNNNDNSNSNKNNSNNNNNNSSNNNNNNNNNNDININNKNKVIKDEDYSIGLHQDDLHPGIKALTAACGEKILNREFLIQGGGDPFVGGLSTDEGGSSDLIEGSENAVDILNSAATDGHPRIILYSEKMRGLKNLLLSEKLNTHAISLQLTAQSQVQVGGKRSATTAIKDVEVGVGTSSCTSSRPKRSRRELTTS